MSDFQIQTTLLSSVVLHILSNERPRELTVCHLWRLLQSHELLWVDVGTEEELLTYSAKNAPHSPLMHSSSVKKFSWLSCSCVHDSEQ